MLDLQYALMKICASNKDGSEGTQAARRQILFQIAEELRGIGFRNLNAHNLKPKHVEGLVKFWQQKELAPGTIKNRMAALRWWCEKVGRESIIPRDNALLGIADRVFVDNDNNRAKALNEQKLETIKDPYVKMSLELQQAFGLRREESIKFQPSFADHGDKIVLKGTWCKGGRVREIPIRNDYQRQVLDRAHQLAQKGSLIPQEKSYVQQLKLYEQQTRLAGLSKMHGLRHRYAQTRYEELTGRPAPAAGGKTSKELTSAEKRLDQMARLQISQELGHVREAITAVYLGR